VLVFPAVALGILGRERPAAVAEPEGARS
jgi:hypothetical protein